MSQYLPQEIIFDILLRLPANCIIRSRCVCKTWFKLFQNPKFINMHLNHHATQNNNTSLMLIEHHKIHSVEYDSLSKLLLSSDHEVEYPVKSAAGYYDKLIKATCNGLFLSSFRNDRLLIWNPCTRKYKEIPIPTVVYRHIINVTYGFAYDSIIDDYKLVRIPTFGGWRFPNSEVMVFTLGSNSWRYIQSIVYNNFDKRQPGVFANRTLHWIARANFFALERSSTIISFDISKEIVKIVAKPKYLDDKAEISLGLLGGCLSIVSHIEMVSTDVWVMKEYGVGESWTKLFTITDKVIIESSNLRPVQFSNNGDILLVKNNTSLLSYDRNNETTTIIKIPLIHKYWNTLWTYVGSLVSLNSGTYVGQDQEETKETFQQKKKKLKRR